MSQIFINNFSTTLASALSDIDSTIYIVGTELIDAASSSIGPPFGYLTIKEGTKMEIVNFNEAPTLSGANCYFNIYRGREGTVAQSFTTEATVELLFTAKTANHMGGCFNRAGYTTPALLPKRPDNGTAIAGTVYYYYNDPNTLLLECTTEGVTAVTPPVLTSGDVGTIVTDGGAEFIVHQLISSSVIDSPENANMSLISSEGIGLSSTIISDVYPDIEYADPLYGAAINQKSIAMAGSTYATNAITLGSGLKNTVKGSFMHTGIPTIPSGFTVGQLGNMLVYGSGSEAIVMSKTINFKNLESVEENLPLGCMFYIDEVGVIFDDSSGTITNLPFVQFNYDDVYATAQLVGTYNTGSRKVLTPLTKDGQQYLQASVTTAASGTGDLYGRFYFKGIFTSAEYTTKFWMTSGGGG